MILDCKSVAQKILEEAKDYVLKNDKLIAIKIIRVTGDEASIKYVNNKVKKCKEVGIKSIVEVLPNNISEDKLIEKIKEANNDANITGILVQLPLPKHLNEHNVINAIDPSKDVDCLTEYNVGKLFSNQGKVAPCTPVGIIEILKHHNVKLRGKNVLIINRSMLVGKPLIELLQREDATVTLAHSKTFNLYKHIFDADIIITATGKRELINKNVLKELNAINYSSYNKTYIIDVSINFTDDKKLCGDVVKDNDFIEELENVYVTPVPGGVGLTTVASLIKNTITLAK